MLKYLKKLILLSIAAKCFSGLSGLFSPNLIDQSSCKMGLVLACVVRMLHNDWPISLGENRPDRVYIWQLCSATKGKFPKELFNLKTLYKASNQELRSWLHTFAAKTLIDFAWYASVKSFIFHWFNVKAKIKSKIQDLNILHASVPFLWHQSSAED